MTRSDFDPGSPLDLGFDFGKHITGTLFVGIGAVCFTVISAAKGIQLTRKVTKDLTDAGFKFFDKVFVDD